MNIYLVIFITLIAALIASFSQLSYKKGLKKHINSAKDVIMAFTNKSVIIGGCGYIVSLVVYLFALSNAPLSVVYPVFASSFIFITILSAHHLKEAFSKTRLVGVLLIFLGIIIISTTV